MVSPAPSPRETGPARRISPVQLILWLMLGLTMLSIIGFALWFQLAEGPRRAITELPALASVPPFELIDRDGSPFGLDDLAGSPWIADFIFTRCAAICPRMTREMSEVSKALGPNTPVQLVSVSVDPEHDTPEVLDAWAKTFDAGENWHFLTGEVETIHQLARKGFMLGVDAAADPETATPGTAIVHSNRFVLVDAAGQIRGFYDPFDPSSVERLLADVTALSR